MKLNKETLKSLINDVIEESFGSSIIDDETYNEYKNELKKYELNEKNKKQFEDDYIPYQTFKDMKGFNQYIVPTVRKNKTKAKIKDLSSKQADGFKKSYSNDVYNLGDVVYISGTKIKKNGDKIDDSHEYVIVGIDGDDVELKETMPPSADIKNKANAVAKYEERQIELADANKAKADAEQTSLFEESDDYQEEFDYMIEMVEYVLDLLLKSKQKNYSNLKESAYDIGEVRKTTNYLTNLSTRIK